MHNVKLDNSLLVSLHNVKGGNSGCMVGVGEKDKTGQKHDVSAFAVSLLSGSRGIDTTYLLHWIH